MIIACYCGDMFESYDDQPVCATCGRAVTTPWTELMHREMEAELQEIIDHLPE